MGLRAGLKREDQPRRCRAPSAVRAEISAGPWARGLAAPSWMETQPVVPCVEQVFRLCRGAHVPQRPSLSPGGSLALTLSSMSWAGDCPEEARVSGKQGVTRAATGVWPHLCPLPTKA